jgi:hypothetical protein
MASIVVSKKFDYSQKKASIPAVRKTRRFQPTNGGTFQGSGGTSVIRIPVRGEMFLDGQKSYLKFTLTNLETTAKLKLTSSCESVFSRIRVLVGGVIASDVQNLNVLNELLSTHASEGYNKQKQMVSGRSVVDADGDASEIIGEEIGTASSVTYCCPIFSGFLNSKLLPLELFGTQSITLELYLAEPAQIGIWDAVLAKNGYSISDVEYIASMVEIQDDSFLNDLKSKMSSATGLEFHGTTFTTHVNSLGATATSASINIPERSKSLKAIMTVFLSTPNLSHYENNSLACRYPHKTPGANFNYNYRVGSELMPAVANGSSSEAYLEYLKIYESPFNTKNSTYCNRFRWNSKIDSTTESGCFTASISLETFNLMSGLAESGLDTASNATNISFQANGIELGAETTVLSYCYKDVIWRLSNGAFEVSL